MTGILRGCEGGVQGGGGAGGPPPRGRGQGDGEHADPPHHRQRNEEEPSAQGGREFESVRSITVVVVIVVCINSGCVIASSFARCAWESRELSSSPLRIWKANIFWRWKRFFFASFVTVPFVLVGVRGFIPCLHSAVVVVSLY